MNLLAMVQAVAKNANVAPPISITSSADDVLFTQFINEAGNEVARRVDWGGLRSTATVTGTGESFAAALPTDYARLSPGLAVLAGTDTVRGSLTADEWLSIEPVEGTPRYFYLTGSKISLYPFLANDAQASVSYQSSYWASNDVGPQPQLVLGLDNPRIPSELLVSGATWRWRRHVGKDFADYVAEFEAMLNDLSMGDGGVRQP